MSQLGLIRSVSAFLYYLAFICEDDSLNKRGDPYASAKAAAGKTREYEYEKGGRTPAV